MTHQDIRWQQRLANYKKALAQVSNGVALARARELSDLERQGVIKAFEFTFELAWNVMKDYLQYQGAAKIIGSRDAIREAFANELIADGDGWMAMLVDRNKTSHTYNQDVAKNIEQNVIATYYGLFVDFERKMDEKCHLD